MELINVFLGLMKEFLAFLNELISFSEPKENEDKKGKYARLVVAVIAVFLILVIIVAVISNAIGDTNKPTDPENNDSVVQSAPKETEADKDDEMELLQKVQDHVANKDYAVAINLLEEAKLQFPASTSIANLYDEVKGVIEVGIQDILNNAQDLASEGDYDAAIALLQQGIKIYGDDKRLSDKEEQFRLADAIAEAKRFAQDSNYAEALKILLEELEKYPLDVELIKLYGEYESIYIDEILKRVDELFDSGDYDGAVAELEAAMKILPECEQFAEKEAFLRANKPVPITDTSLSEQHTPNDVATSVNCTSWDENNDLDICMNRFGGGLKIELSNMFTSFGSGSSNAIKSRLAVTFSPENHTQKEFSGVIVLDQSMYGSSTYGTIRILVNNEEVFSTGRVDGSCESSFPFTVDITNTSVIVFEADVVLKGSSFIYGIVDNK